MHLSSSPKKEGAVILSAGEGSLYFISNHHDISRKGPVLCHLACHCTYPRQ